MARKKTSTAPVTQYVDESIPAAIYMDVAELRRWIGNPRKNKKAVAKAVESIKMFGWGAPLLARLEDNEIIAGDTRIQAAEALGIKRVPVRQMPLSAKKAHALGLADNRVGEIASWDKEKLKATAQEYKHEVPMFEATGFKYDDFFPKKLSITQDEIPAPPKVPIVKAGEIWQLGTHLLVCGDSFDQATRDRVLKNMADLVLCDPPYAIYGSSNGLGADIADDKMIRPFFTSLFQIVNAHLKEFGHAYACCDWRSWSAIYESACRAKLSPKNCIVWDKGDAGLGSMYGMAHEFIGFFAKSPPATSLKSTTKRGHRTVLSPNIMRHKRVSGEERQNNAAKPVEMFKSIIANSSDEGDLVVDFFGGSGTTIIAAEQMKRRAVVFEIEPKEADVILRRFELRTEKKPIRLDV